MCSNERCGGFQNMGASRPNHKPKSVFRETETADEFVEDDLVDRLFSSCGSAVRFRESRIL